MNNTKINFQFKHQNTKKPQSIASFGDRTSDKHDSMK